MRGPHMTEVCYSFLWIGQELLKRCPRCSGQSFSRIQDPNAFFFVWFKRFIPIGGFKCGLADNDSVPRTRHFPKLSALAFFVLHVDDSVVA